ncbi:unnamed protein product, partial [marine sediment metagenome]
NRIPFVLYSLLVRDFLETNGDIITCFELFSTFKKVNVNVFLESNKYKTILYFPKSQSDTFKLEIFNNTKKSDISLFLKENWHIIEHWKWEKKIPAPIKIKGITIKRKVAVEVPDYLYKKRPVKGLFRNIVFLLEDYKKRKEKEVNIPDVGVGDDESLVEKYKDYYLIDEVFGESEDISPGIDKKRIANLRKMRERLSKTDTLSPIIPA